MASLNTEIGTSAIQIYTMKFQLSDLLNFFFFMFVKVQNSHLFHP